MIRILLCDDDPAFLKQIESYIADFAEETSSEIAVSSYTDGGQLLELDVSPYDILLLDISMKESNGLDVAHRLRQKGCDICLFFITTMTQYAIEGYEVHAFGFLKKPIEYARFTEKITEAVAWCKRNKGIVLELKKGPDTFYIKSKDIIYVDVLKHELDIITKDGRQSFYVPITQLEASLAKLDFFRCHKSFLVNLGEIKSFGKDIIMSNGDIVPLSRRRKAEFLKALSAYAGRTLQ